MSAAAAALDCGWSGAPIRRNLTAQISYLTWAVGTCQEYTSASAELQPVEKHAPANGSSTSEVFVPTPLAGYCDPGGGGAANLSDLAYWLHFVNCIVFFLFLMRLRRNQRYAAGQLDKALWSAADYSVMLTGVDKGVHADDQPDGAVGLESRVRADLAAMGFASDRIVQVEVARECLSEVRAIRKLGQIKTREQELRSKIKKREASGRDPGEKVRAEVEKIEAEKAEIQKDLDFFRADPVTDETIEARMLEMLALGCLPADARPLRTDAPAASH